MGAIFRQVNNFAHELAKIRLDTIDSYVEQMEHAINEKSEQLARITEERAKDMPEEVADEYYEFHYDDFHRLERDFPSLLRYSIVTAVISTIEQALVRTCRSHYDENPNLKHYRKYGDKNNLEKFSYYIMEQMNIDFPNESEEWEFILNVYNVRNNIVHSNGRINDGKDVEGLKNSIQELPFVSSSHEKEIHIDKEFCPLLIKNTQILLNSVFTKIKESISN
ncbi:hypothetical protein [Halobacillus sp. A5]|uniref:hypothetical protein n=1 Tax=Halobacillus sp. A5 TaxID=2880263 RepID=UPI0020A671A5|nr:hypothetical protein [Halobacillus sp. A5]MCP3026862.1 hypothetical protein [Halobacillus sp. A5]